MLQLLSPAGLWALAALSLPLAIHLWRPPPRTVRLGSLRFLENLPRRLHDLRWRERWLLAARLALLALLALLLAGPRWERLPPRGPQHWVLLDPTAVPAGESMNRLHALQSRGYEMHALAPGLPALFGVAGKRTAAAPDLWSLLREADAGLPAGSSLAVFSPVRLASLRGSRPALGHCRVEWVRTPDVPAAPVAPAPAIAPPPPLRILILHDAGRATDARYVAAAIRAAAQVSGRAIDVRQSTENPAPGDSMEWLFWLRAQPVRAGWTALGANVLEEASSDTPAAGIPASWVVPGGARLWQRTTPPLESPAAVFWTDGFGQPLLTVTHEGRGRHWRFFGRFDPVWTDLPLGSGFPEWMRTLLFQQDDRQPIDPVEDRRLADPDQYPTAAEPSGRDDITLQRAAQNPIDLYGPLWLLAAILFAVERVLSARRRPSAAALPVEPAVVASSR